MLTKFALIVAAALAIALAVPASPAASASERNGVTLVKQDCPKGDHWSYGFRQCVRDW